MTKTDEFVRELQQLCGKHNASIFPRTDELRLYVSVEIGPYATATVSDFLWITHTEAPTRRAMLDAAARAELEKQHGD